LEELESPYNKEFSIQIHQHSDDWSLLLGFYDSDKQKPLAQKVPTEAKALISRFQKYTGISPNLAEALYWAYQTFTTQSLLLNSTILKSTVRIANIGR
jgi:hypothetical protein